MSKNFGDIYRSTEISVIFIVEGFWDIEIELPFESHLPCQPNRNLIKPFGFIHKLSDFFLINMRIRIFHYSLVHSFLRKQRAGKGKDREREEEEEEEAYASIMGRNTGVSGHGDDTMFKWGLFFSGFSDESAFSIRLLRSTPPWENVALHLRNHRERWRKRLCVHLKDVGLLLFLFTIKTTLMV